MIHQLHSCYRSLSLVSLYEFMLPLHEQKNEGDGTLYDEWDLYKYRKFSAKFYVWHVRNNDRRSTPRAGDDSWARDRSGSGDDELQSLGMNSMSSSAMCIFPLLALLFLRHESGCPRCSRETGGKRKKLHLSEDRVQVIKYASSKRFKIINNMTWIWNHKHLKEW